MLNRIGRALRRDLSRKRHLVREARQRPSPDSPVGRVYELVVGNPLRSEGEDVFVGRNGAPIHEKMPIGDVREVAATAPPERVGKTAREERLEQAFAPFLI